MKKKHEEKVQEINKENNHEDYGREGKQHND